jgi:GTP-binding protein EngB required for normal cell division
MLDMLLRHGLQHEVVFSKVDKLSRSNLDEELARAQLCALQRLASSVCSHLWTRAHIYTFDSNVSGLSQRIAVLGARRAQRLFGVVGDQCKNW